MNLFITKWEWFVLLVAIAGDVLLLLCGFLLGRHITARKLAPRCQAELDAAVMKVTQDVTDKMVEERLRPILRVYHEALFDLTKRRN